MDRLIDTGRLINLDKQIVRQIDRETDSRQIDRQINRTLTDGWIDRSKYLQVDGFRMTDS